MIKPYPTGCRFRTDQRHLTRSDLETSGRPAIEVGREAAVHASQVRDGIQEPDDQSQQAANQGEPGHDQ